jgi:peptidoglycan/LPS O-acetylase OafA/YrhL
MGLGFAVLMRISEQHASIRDWALSFWLNSAGFIFWSGIVNMDPRLYYLLGEALHVAGFFFMVFGALRFCGIIRIGWKSITFALCWLLLWAASLCMLIKMPLFTAIALKLLRALLFSIGGALLLAQKSGKEPIGQNFAGISLLLWAAFISLSVFVKLDDDLFIGLLVGFHVLAAFGMIVMIVGRLRVSTEKMERQVQRLEGILPICAHCKKIRDEKGSWRILEEYIEDRSRAEFSHGICPDCMKRFHPEITRPAD